MAALSGTRMVIVLTLAGVHARQACLKEHGTCPFTKAPLSWEQCTVLTLHNSPGPSHMHAGSAVWLCGLLVGSARCLF